jgi:hypothetical protein
MLPMVSRRLSRDVDQTSTLYAPEFRSFLFHHNLRNESRPTSSQDDLRWILGGQIPPSPDPSAPRAHTHRLTERKEDTSPPRRQAMGSQSQSLPLPEKQCPILTGPVEQPVLQSVPARRSRIAWTGLGEGDEISHSLFGSPQNVNTHQLTSQASAVGNNPVPIE